MKKIILIIALFFIFNINVCASYVVFDQDSNRVLSGENIHEKRLIASITKVMTAYVVINNANLDDEVIVGDEIDLSHGSSIYLKKGEKIKVIDLLYGMMLRSGNDAATVLAVHTFGSLENFIYQMNNEVKKMGLNDTVFQNPTGLDDDGSKNISSAYDMAYITSISMKNKTFKKIFSTKKYSVKTNMNMHVWYNKNKALFMNKYINGGKTGYTKKAHRTLITTSSKDNINLVVVSLDMGDDFNFHVKSHKNIFNNYNSYLILNKSNLGIKNSYYKNAKFYIDKNYRLTLNKKDLNKLSIVYELYKIKKVKNNDIVGKVKVLSNNEIIYETPLYILINKGL